MQNTLLDSAFQNPSYLGCSFRYFFEKFSPAAHFLASFFLFFCPWCAFRSLFIFFLPATLFQTFTKNFDCCALIGVFKIPHQTPKISPSTLFPYPKKFCGALLHRIFQVLPAAHLEIVFFSKFLQVAQIYTVLKKSLSPG